MKFQIFNSTDIGTLNDGNPWLQTFQCGRYVDLLGAGNTVMLIDNSAFSNWFEKP